jgi:hypothetical protein
MLTPAMPVAPTLNIELPANRSLILAGSIVLFAVLSGILAGLAIRDILNDQPAAKPGPVAELYQPTLTRIAQAKALAAGPTQTMQVTQTAASIQGTRTIGFYQSGSDISQAQNGLSSFYLQGSVGTTAR